jgi:xanthine permease XanP
MSDLTNSPEQKDHLDLVYGLNDRPKPFIAFLAALQHLLAIIVPIVTPGLLICLALGVSKQDTNMILSMSLVISGIATFLQCKKVGPFGAGLLIVQGTSFNFIGPIIGIGSAMVTAGTRTTVSLGSGSTLPVRSRGCADLGQFHGGFGPALDVPRARP